MRTCVDHGPGVTVPQSSEPLAPPDAPIGDRDEEFIEEEIGARAPELGLGLPPRALAALPLPRKLNLPDMFVGRARVLASIFS